MSACNAMLLVCDEANMSLTSGKHNLIGIYTGEIGIPKEPQILNQIVFYFVIDCDLTKLPPVMIVEITIPGDTPKQLPIPMLPTPPMPIPPNRTRGVLQIPFAMRSLNVRAGRIEGRVIYGSEVVPVLGPMLTVSPPVTSEAPTAP